MSGDMLWTSKSGLAYRTFVVAAHSSSRRSRSWFQITIVMKKQPKTNLLMSSTCCDDVWRRSVVYGRKGSRERDCCAVVCRYLVSIMLS